MDEVDVNYGEVRREQPGICGKCGLPDGTYWGFLCNTCRPYARSLLAHEGKSKKAPGLAYPTVAYEVAEELAHFLCDGGAIWVCDLCGMCRRISTPGRQLLTGDFRAPFCSYGSCGTLFHNFLLETSGPIRQKDVWEWEKKRRKKEDEKYEQEVQARMEEERRMRTIRPPTFTTFTTANGADIDPIPRPPTRGRRR